MQPKNKSILSMLPASQEAFNNIPDTSLELWWGHLLVGFPDGSAGKESTCNVGDLDLIPGLGRAPGEEKGYPLQYSGLENSMGCVVHGVTKSQTRLSYFHSLISYLASLMAQWVQNLPAMQRNTGDLG